MRRLVCSFVLTCIVLMAGPWGSEAAAQSSALTFVDYQGQRIELSRVYRDFDEYKDDARNLGVQQVWRVEQLMRETKFGPSFNDADAVHAALAALQFPGYGMLYANQLKAGIEPALELAYVEIPQRDLNRYFVLEKYPAGDFRVIADVVVSSLPEANRVRRASDGKLEFLRADGKVAFIK